MDTTIVTNGYLGEVLAAHEDENVDFLMSRMTDIGDRMSSLKHQVEDIVLTTYGKFSRVPREARRMKVSLKNVTGDLETLDAKIKLATPKLQSSTSELTKLSKRNAEISLMKKIVDELVKLNSGFVAAQDFQKEKKYFDAVKSFELLNGNLENTSEDVKRLSIFGALVDETARSRVYLQDLMTNTLIDCFKCQVTTGIDATRISYFTLRVDKSRKEDIEESFQALHYIKKLNSFLVEFAGWLKDNMMLPIILHCCSVTADDEGGKYMVLKVEVDFTLPKCDFMKVFENLTFVLVFLKTYLSATVGGNSTIMKELGKLMTKDFSSALISHCLADTIPSHSNQLEEYKTVIAATERFHSNLKIIGFLDESSSNLIDYTTNAEKLCATKTAKLLLVRAREIIVKDLYDIMEVEIVPEVRPKPVKKEVRYEEGEMLTEKIYSELEETPKEIEMDKSMLADMEKMHQEFLKSLNVVDNSKELHNMKNYTPLKDDSDRKQSPSKQKSPGQLPTPLKKVPELLQSPVKEDSVPIKSSVKEDSQKHQSPGLDDCDTHVKSNVIVDSPLSQKKSPSNVAVDNLLNDDPEPVECLERESLQKENPALEDSEQMSDPGNEHTHVIDIGACSAGEPPELSEKRTKSAKKSSLLEKSTIEFMGDHESSQNIEASHQNLSQEGSCASSKPVKPLGEIEQETLDESTDEEFLLETTHFDAKFDTISNKNVTNFNLSGSIFAFPKCQISKSANELIILLNEVLNDCVGTSNQCARNLFKTARKIVELYCAIAPIYHRKYLETIPQQAALYHNNCLYIAHCLLTLGHFERTLLPEGAQAIGSFVDQVTVVRSQGASVFLSHMHFQRNQMLDIIRNCGLSTLRECSTLTPDTEKALRQCLRQLELLKSVWQPVLPINVYVNSMACLMNSFLDELINRVATVQDIPADTASQLVKMFGVVVIRVNAIFPDPKIVEEFEYWEKFQELVLILGASMKCIKDRWANGHGPPALHFSPEQLRQLIRALFQNTERRSAFLAEIY